MRARVYQLLDLEIMTKAEFVRAVGADSKTLDRFLHRPPGK